MRNVWLRGFTVSALVVWSGVVVGRAQAVSYTIPSGAVTLDRAGADAVLSARTMAIIAVAKPTIELSANPTDKTVTVVEHGGIRRGIDPEKAAKSVREMLAEWRRFSVVESPADADLVLVIVEDAVPPSRFSRMNGDSQHRLRDRLTLFSGRQEPAQTRALWSDVSTESTFGVLTGSSARKVADKFRSDIDKRSGSRK
jgi:hypothetical protein